MVEQTSYKRLVDGPIPSIPMMLKLKKEGDVPIPSWPRCASVEQASSNFMKKVFIIHGFEGSPNGGWRPWLMTELGKQEVYACALSMPTPENPICKEWIDEISRHIQRNSKDEIYLVAHSLGVTAILRYLESIQAKSILGAVLVSGPSKNNDNSKINNFLDKNFNFEKIKSNCKQFSIIHGDNDSIVTLDNAKFLSQQLNCNLIVVPDGGRLNGSAGWFKLQQCLEALNKMMK